MLSRKRSVPFATSCPLVLLTALAVACACQGQPTNATGQLTTPAQALSPSGVELSWPRQFEDNGTRASIFKPQIEKWEGNNFETRSAVAITPAGSNAPIYGVFWMKARADVDKSARIVTLNDIVVTRANFPSAQNTQINWLTLIRKNVPLVSKAIALDHLEAELRHLGSRQEGPRGPGEKRSAVIHLQHDTRFARLDRRPVGLPADPRYEY